MATERIRLFPRDAAPRTLTTTVHKVRQTPQGVECVTADGEQLRALDPNVCTILRTFTDGTLVLTVDYGIIVGVGCGGVMAQPRLPAQAFRDLFEHPVAQHAGMAGLPIRVDGSAATLDLEVDAGSRRPVAIVIGAGGA